MKARSYFHHALMNEDDLGYFIYPSRPGITNKLRIEGRNAVSLLEIASEGGLPLQDTGCAAEIADRIDEGNKDVPGLTVRVILMAQRLVNVDAPVLDGALK